MLLILIALLPFFYRIKYFFLIFGQKMLQTHGCLTPELRSPNTRVNHTMPSPKIFIPAFLTVKKVVVTWLTILEDRLQSTLG